MIESYEQGTCPRCGSVFEYQPAEFADDAIYYPFTCQRCGASGKEWYELKYIITEA